MKKTIALLLCLVLCLTLGSAAFADETASSGEESAAYYYEAVTAVDGKLPTVTPAEGYSFRGFFTTDDGAGARVTEANVANYASFYAKYTLTAEIYDYEVIAFGTIPYIDYTDEDGNVIGYRGEEEDFRMMKEFGIDVVTLDAVREGNQYEDFLKNVAWAEQYGIDYFVSDTSVMDENLTKEQLDELTKDYVNNAHFRGFYIADEPGYGALPSLRRIINNLQAAYPFADCHTNLCSFELISGWSTLAEYYEYYTTYTDAFHLCSDPYPYGNSTDPDHVYTNYYKELQLLAKSASVGNVGMWAYAQLRNDFEDSLRKTKFSIYSQACYGVSGQVLFCYNNTHETEDRGEGGSDSTMFNNLQNRNQVWYDCKEVLADIKTFADIFMQYGWTFTGTTSPIAGCSVLADYAKDTSVLQDVKCDERVIINNFEEKNGTGTAVTLFNDSLFTANKDITVTFKAADTLGATVYIGDTSYTLTPAADGTYTVQVPSCEMALVTFNYYN